MSRQAGVGARRVSEGALPLVDGGLVHTRIPYLESREGVRARVLGQRKALETFLGRTKGDPKRVAGAILDDN